MEVTVLYCIVLDDGNLPYHEVGTYSTRIISLSSPFGLNKFFFYTNSPFTIYRSPYQKRGEQRK